MDRQTLDQLLVLQTALEYLYKEEEPKDYDPKGFHEGPRHGRYFRPGEREAGGKEVEIVQAPEAESPELDLTEKLPPTNQTPPDDVPNWIETPNGARAMGDSIPRYWYHRPPGHGAEGTPSGGLQAYNMDPKEIEVTSGFYSDKLGHPRPPEPEQFLWMSPVSRMAEGEFVIDITKLNDADMRFTGQAEGNLLHRGDISPDGIVRRPKSEHPPTSTLVEGSASAEQLGTRYGRIVPRNAETGEPPTHLYRVMDKRQYDDAVEKGVLEPAPEEFGGDGRIHGAGKPNLQYADPKPTVLVAIEYSDDDGWAARQAGFGDITAATDNPIPISKVTVLAEGATGRDLRDNYKLISDNLSKLLVLETALEFMQDSSQGFLLQKSVEAENVVKVGDVDIPVELALDPAKGLSGRGSMNPGTGMLFSMPNARDFWMKDMKFPLDIVWINDKREVVDITENIPVPNSSFMPLYSPRRLSTYALEINGGEAKALGINIGDAVEMNIS